MGADILQLPSEIFLSVISYLRTWEVQALSQTFNRHIYQHCQPVVAQQLVRDRNTNRLRSRFSKHAFIYISAGNEHCRRLYQNAGLHEAYGPYMAYSREKPLDFEYLELNGDFHWLWPFTNEVPAPLLYCNESESPSYESEMAGQMSMTTDILSQLINQANESSILLPRSFTAFYRSDKLQHVIASIPGNGKWFVSPHIYHIQAKPGATAASDNDVNQYEPGNEFAENEYIIPFYTSANSAFTWWLYLTRSIDLQTPSLEGVIRTKQADFPAHPDLGTFVYHFPPDTSPPLLPPSSSTLDSEEAEREAQRQRLQPLSTAPIDTSNTTPTTSASAHLSNPIVSLTSPLPLNTVLVSPSFEDFVASTFFHHVIAWKCDPWKQMSLPLPLPLPLPPSPPLPLPLPLPLTLQNADGVFDDNDLRDDKHHADNENNNKNNHHHHRQHHRRHDELVQAPKDHQHEAVVLFLVNHFAGDRRCPIAEL